MTQVARSSFWLLLMVVILLAPLTLFAQDKPSSDVSITGCLQKGVEAGGFYLTDASGKTYELQSKANLAEHVAHQVTVTGQVVQNSPAKEAKLAESEKKEASGKTYQDLKVTGLTMVSTSCK